MFTEGHLSTAGRDLYDVSLSEEAIRLTRWLHARLPETAEITGLLALMLLTDARRASRLDEDGSIIPLDRQDRTRWDHGRLREGIALIEAALPVGRVGPYQLQAAIAAVHAEAARAEDTDWTQIEVLYRMLADQAPGPVVTLNHAVAVAMVQGPEAGAADDRPVGLDPGAAAQPSAAGGAGAPARSRGTPGGGAGRVRGGGPAGDEHPGAALPQRAGRGHVSLTPARGRLRQAGSW